MKNFVSFATLAAVAALGGFSSSVSAGETSQPVHAATESAAVDVHARKVLYGPDGRRIALIYRVLSGGHPQLILDGKLVTVPASTLSSVDGKVSTSLTKKELAKSK